MKGIYKSQTIMVVESFLLSFFIVAVLHRIDLTVTAADVLPNQTFTQNGLITTSYEYFYACAAYMRSINTFFFCFFLHIIYVDIVR